MAKPLNIPKRDRDFCLAVAEAVFRNPFDDSVKQLHGKIIGSRRRIGPDNDVEAINSALAARVKNWHTSGRINFRNYCHLDAEIMRMVSLFEVYHRYFDQLDQLVVDQTNHVHGVCRVSFAEELLLDLEQRGFTTDESTRYFGILFQVRRAHHFITHGLIGDSSCMKEFRRNLWNNVFTHDIRHYDRFFHNRMEDFSTLLLGETGTGKGVAAAAIGRSGFIPFDRKRGEFTENFTSAFTSLNLSQFHESLIESELFGHAKGAFTGAINQHKGILATCSRHGSVLLDEIGDVSVPIQIKLLRVLQEREFTSIGKREPTRFHGRVIAATNKSIDQLREEGLFRDDFYYRLCSDVIVVPPLKQRLQEDPKELNRLLTTLVDRLAGESSSELCSLVEDTILKHVGHDYAWPGNVRELEQAARRVLLTRRFDGAQAAPPNLKSSLLSGLEQGKLSAEELLAGYCKYLYSQSKNYESVARQTKLDRRTAKKYILRESTSTV